VLEATSSQLGTWRLRVVVTGEAIADGRATEVPQHISTFADGTAATHARSSAEHSDAMRSPLAVVLSSTGSLFPMSTPGPRDERRDTHRRTRRGKHRRTRPSTLTQPRLFDRAFDRSSSK
jgi:hypothetical protein